jgi:hypothetical protein
VTFGQIHELMRRHLIAVSVVFVFAIGMLYVVKSSPIVYDENADVIFTAPAPHANPYSSFTSSLISTADVMTRIMLNPQSQQRVRNAGGTAYFNVGLVNLYNLQFPYYGDPYVAVSTVSVDPASAHRTFEIVAAAFQRLVATQQVQAGVPPISRIATHLVADTGPVPERGSNKRAYAGIILLAIIGAFMVARLLDRHPIHLGVSLRRWRGRAGIVLDRGPTDLGRS